VTKLIVITGTPGVGKSTLARRLAKKKEFTRLDLHNFYKDISTGYDRSAKCYDINLKKLQKLVETKLDECETKYLVLDSHIAHLLPKKLVYRCLLLTCDLKKLKRRLVGRKYSTRKIQENLQAEIFQVCLEEAQEQRHQVTVVKDPKIFKFPR
jgi:adenylate kinase